MKNRRNRIPISLDYSLEPIAFLEGGKGLNNCETFIHKTCFHKGLDMWLLDDLYSKPERIAALKFLKPKTLILGTTGVYEDKLNQLIDLFFDMEITSIENIILTLDSEDVLYKHLVKLPKVKFLKPMQVYSFFDEVGKDVVEFYEIKL